MERKGIYKYSQEELDRNKIIKMQQDELQELQQRSELLKTATDMLNADCKSQDQDLSELYHKSEELRVKALKLAKGKGLNPVKI